MVSWFLIKILLTLNAICGATLFIWAWKITKLIRTPDWKRDQYILSMCRNDAKRWDRFWMFIGATTIMIPRVIIVVLSTSGACFFTKIATSGVTLKEGEYYSGWRKSLIQYAITIGSTINRLALGITLSIQRVEENEIDYSYYLGKDYKLKYQTPPGAVPTVISPHVSINDIPLLMKAFKGNLSFVAGEFMLNVPMYGSMCKALGCVFVPREGSKS